MSVTNQAGSALTITIDTTNAQALKYYCLQCSSNDSPTNVIFNSLPFQVEIVDTACSATLSIATNPPPLGD